MLKRRTQKLKISQINKDLTPEDWHAVGAVGEPAFQNGWVNYGDIWSTCEFYKDQIGIVHVKGLVKSGTINSVIFTLPVGYRPTHVSHFVALGNSTTPINTGLLYPNGDVKQRTGSNGYFSLDRLSFRAEQ